MHWKFQQLNFYLHDTAMFFLNSDFSWLVNVLVLMQIKNSSSAHRPQNAPESFLAGNNNLRSGVPPLFVKDMQTYPCPGIDFFNQLESRIAQLISLRIRVLFRACLPCEQSHLRSSFLFPIFPRKIEGDSARRVIRVGILSLHRNACYAEKTHEYRHASAPHVTKKEFFHFLPYFMQVNSNI